MYKNYQAYLQSKRLSQLTIKNYLSDYNNFATWYLDNYQETFNPPSLNNNQLKAYSHYLLENSLSPSSKKRRLTSTKIYIRWLNEAYQSNISTSPLQKALISPQFNFKKNKRVSPIRGWYLVPILALTLLFAVVTYTSTLTLKTSPNQGVVEREINSGSLVTYEDIESFRTDVSQYKPSVSGFNHETGRYYILFEKEPGLVSLSY